MIISENQIHTLIRIASLYLDALEVIENAGGLTERGKHNANEVEKLLDTLNKQQSDELKEVK